MPFRPCADPFPAHACNHLFFGIVSAYLDGKPSRDPGFPTWACLLLSICPCPGLRGEKTWVPGQGEGKVGHVSLRQQVTCEFFQALSQRLGLVVFFITHYCHGPGYMHCARHILMSNQEKVPQDLYPNQCWRVRGYLRSQAGRIARATGQSASGG